jgi:hypothetical protein
LPSGNSIAVLNLLALHRATGESSYRDHAAKALGAFSSALAQRPFAMPMMLIALEQYLDQSPDASSPGPRVAAEPDHSPTRVVTASARPAGAINPGSEFDAVVSLVIQDGWHLYANPTGVAELKPTTLRLDRASERSATLVHVKYPPGEAKILGSLGTEKVALYEGKVELIARIRLAQDVKPGSIPLRLMISYQACNDRLCLAPASLEIPLDVSVAR